MNDDILGRFFRRFRTDIAAARQRRKPKLGLPLLKAAGHYKAALDAAASARRDAVAVALGRCDNADDALAALNYLAESFGVPAFRRDDLAGR